MNVKFNINIDLEVWAKAIGYKIVGDKLVKEFKLSDFKEAVQDYIEAMLEAGWNPNAIEENFLVNDKDEFRQDFEYDYEEEKLW